jgi:phage baseplate assembly protein gpV
MARSRITGDQIVDEDVLSEEEHDSWIHRNLVCSGTINIPDTPVMISGTGDIYCKDLYASNDSIYLGDTKLSVEAGTGNILVDDSPITAEADTTGYTGTVSVITDLTEVGIATKKYFIYEDGLLTTVSGNEQVELSGLSLL